MKSPDFEDISCFGYFWILISLTSSIANIVGFYSPNWIKGRLLDHETLFGSFRRCNYPVLSSKPNVTIEIVTRCGRYTTFGDIPSLYWQISTVAIALAASVSLITSLISFFGSFTPGFLSKKCARTLGMIQLMSGFLMVFGISVYPLGFTAREVRDACGNRSGVYRLGTCTMSWSLLVMAAGTVGLLVSCLMSCCAVVKTRSTSAPSSSSVPGGRRKVKRSPASRSDHESSQMKKNLAHHAERLEKSWPTGHDHQSHQSFPQQQHLDDVRIGGEDGPLRVGENLFEREEVENERDSPSLKQVACD